MQTSAKAPSSRSIAMVGILMIVACSPEPTRVIEVPEALMAKAAPAPSVTVSSTTPAFAKRGERV